MLKEIEVGLCSLTGCFWYVLHMGHSGPLKQSVADAWFLAIEFHLKTFAWFLACCFAGLLLFWYLVTATSGRAREILVLMCDLGDSVLVGRRNEEMATPHSAVHMERIWTLNDIWEGLIHFRRLQVSRTVLVLFFSTSFS